MHCGFFSNPIFATKHQWNDIWAFDTMLSKSGQRSNRKKGNLACALAPAMAGLVTSMGWLTSAEAFNVVLLLCFFCP